jgi:hypothetical protein
MKGWWERLGELAADEPGIVSVATADLVRALAELGRARAQATADEDRLVSSACDWSEERERLTARAEKAERERDEAQAARHTFAEAALGEAGVTLDALLANAEARAVENDRQWQREEVRRREAEAEIKRLSAAVREARGNQEHAEGCARRSKVEIERLEAALVEAREVMVPFAQACYYRRGDPDMSGRVGASQAEGEGRIRARKFLEKSAPGREAAEVIEAAVAWEAGGWKTENGRQRLGDAVKALLARRGGEA